MNEVISSIPIIDADTHVIEPPDLWTSRVSSKWGELVPHVVFSEEAGYDIWVVGNMPGLPAAGAAMAGYREYPPSFPKTRDDTDPATWDPVKRLARMDEYGIHAQALYSNIALFGGSSLIALAEPELQLECVQAYNDYQTELAELAPGRYLPMTQLPFWNLDETLAEITRCAGAGHHGIVFTQDPTAFGLPSLSNPHWFPMWALAEETGLAVNFHIAGAGVDISTLIGGDEGPHMSFAAVSTAFFMANARTITQLITGGLCHRFPRLNFVSVESGVGWIPFHLAALDWQWKNCGVHLDHPEYDLLPSEYFRRQIYGCFWFEEETARFAIELYPDNILFETDFPHPTSLSPGPASTAVAPNVHLEKNFGDLPEATLHKILHDNAARIYHLD